MSKNDTLEKKMYEVKEIQDILGISRNGAYGFIRKAHETGKPFRVIKIGGCYRIPKATFDAWLEKRLINFRLKWSIPHKCATLKLLNCGYSIMEEYQNMEQKAGNNPVYFKDGTWYIRKKSYQKI